MTVSVAPVPLSGPATGAPAGGGQPRPEDTQGTGGGRGSATGPGADAPEARTAHGALVLTVFVILSVALVALVLLSAAVGQMGVTPAEVFGSVMHRLGLDLGPLPEHPHAESALWVIRFPRLALALVVGAALAVGGVLMQGVFGNPLADPGIVGVSSGAAAAACAVIVFGLTAFGEWTIVVAAFVGGVLTTAIAYGTARQGGRTEVVTLVLTGIAMNAVAGAVIAFLTFLGDTSAREEIVFWQLGSLNGSRWQHFVVAAPLIVASVLIALRFCRQLDLLALGERPARHLGVNVEALRIRVIVVVAVLTSAAVAFSGVIAFVGLVVPHLLRMTLGPGHRVLLPASALGGAVLLLAADLVARTAVPYADLPIGMLTALVGGPFFFYLIRRTRRGAGGWS